MISCSTSSNKCLLTTLQDSIVHFASERVNSIWTQSLFKCAFYVGSVFLGKAFFPFFLSNTVLARYGKFRGNQQVIEVKNVTMKTIEKIAK